jgi:hypothetical protein
MDASRFQMSIVKELSYLGALANVKRISRSVSMLLCNSCYWCATELEEDRKDKVCPSCTNPVEAIPLEKGEIFSFDIDNMRGVILEFKRRER